MRITLVHSPSYDVGTMSLRLSTVKIFAFENTVRFGRLAAELLEIEETCKLVIDSKSNEGDSCLFLSRYL